MSVTNDAHFANYFLSDAEWQGIPKDQEQSKERILVGLKKLEETLHNTEPLSNIVLGRALRLIKHHKTLKYHFDDDLRVRIASVLLSVYQRKEKITVPMKTKILQTAKIVLKKSWSKINISIDWRFYWSYFMSLVHREGRFDISAAHNVLLDHLKTVSGFIFSVRHYFNPYDTNEAYAEQGLDKTLVDSAMVKLSDLRVPTSIEGLLLLVCCLPTNFTQFDNYLPTWFEVWASIDHNQLWDCCWLMVVARARKHSESYDWGSLLPFFLTKARDILGVPNVAGVANVQSNSFPKSFPTFYQIVLQQFKDLNAKLVGKLAKVVYKCIISQNDTQGATVGPFTISPSNIVVDSLKTLNLQIPAISETTLSVKNSCVTFCQFFQSIRPLLHPSNGNNHVVHLAKFIEILVSCIAKEIGNKIADSLITNNKSVNQLYWNTLQYLQGIFLIISLESLNSKNFVVQRSYVTCLNQLLSLNPVYVHAIVPFLLDALEPKSVSQPHRTLAALNALGACMRTMLYPNPIILRYLPDILRLSLPGIDPSDPKKTVVTMELFTNIFAWIPIHSKLTLKKSSIANYTDFLSVESSPVSKVIVTDGEYDAQLETYSTYVTDEWISAFFEKVFALIGGLEKKVKGTKDSPMVSSVSQCVGFVFQALIFNETQRQTINDLQDKILNYVLTSAPLHCFKISAKLLESITSNDQTRLAYFFQKIFDSDIFTTLSSNNENQNAPIDKIKFRLVLAGGCCRSAQSASLVSCLPILKPIIFNKSLLHHEDIKIRKSFAKFLKDFMKGSISLYPIEIKANYSSSLIFAEPNLPSKNDIKWNIPSAASITAVVEVIREITDQSTQEIQQALTAAAESANGTTPSLSYKKCEDLISNNLLLFVKMVRGMADILGDSYDPDAMTLDNEYIDEKILLSTGRETLIASLSDSNKTYLLTYRRHLLTFLSKMYEQLEQFKDSTTYRGLYDNDYIAKQWMKCLMFTLTRRTSALKDHDGIKKWLKYQKFQNSSVMVRAIYESFKYSSHNNNHNHGNHNGIDAKFKDPRYWKFHDSNTNYIACKVWLQHSIRASELSHAAVRVYVDGNNEHDPTIKCINQLMSLARHEYDSIRPQARKIFEKISSHLGYKIVKIIENTLKLLLLPNATYYQTASTLVTMKQNSVMKRLASNIELKMLFFNSLVVIQQSVANITDLDKREKVMLSLTDAISKYSTCWAHSEDDLQQFYQQIFPSAFNYFGNMNNYSSNTTTTNNNNDTAMEVDTTNTAVSTGGAAGGLRFDTFLGYFLLHCVSSPLSFSSNQYVKSIWQLMIKFLSEGHGQPTLFIGEALLARIAEITYQNYLKSSNEISSMEWYQTMKETFSSKNNSNANDLWKRIILGLARCHPIAGSEGENNTNNNPQWSSGIEHILTASEFLRIVKTRKFTSKGFEHNLCSIYFRKENVASFFSLIQSGLVNISNVTDLEEIFQMMKDIPTTSETEKRAVNCTLAEFYSGFLRAYYDASNQSKQSHEMEKLLLSYLLERIENLSMDYCRDWEEAIFFGLECRSFESFTLIHRHILDNFYSILRLNATNSAAAAATAVTTAAPGGAGEMIMDEGFTRQGKGLMLTIALLNADCVSRAANKDRNLLVATEILNIFIANDANLIIPYRTSRIELASILTTLTDHLSHNVGHVDHQAKLMALYQKIATEVTNKVQSAAPVVAPTNPTPEEGNAPAPEETKNIPLKNTIDTVLHIIPKLSQRIPIKYNYQVFHALFPILIEGVIHSEIEISRNSSDSLIFLINALFSWEITTDKAALFYQTWIEKLHSFYLLYQSSWKIKEVIMKLILVLMTNNWFLLQENSRKLAKDLFTLGLNDLQLNVREVASIGMIGYLAYKTPQEMKIIAESYTRNSETLATREKQKRKQLKLDQQQSASSAAGSNNNNVKPDGPYINTIQMMSCVILTMSYDLPDYLPNLITSFLRHVHYYDVLKSLITKTIQLFRRTHQDRWEEFQLKFSSEQLADLQGAGAAHYFS